MNDNKKSRGVIINQSKRQKTYGTYRIKLSIKLCDVCICLQVGYFTKRCNSIQYNC